MLLGIRCHDTSRMGGTALRTGSEILANRKDAYNPRLLLGAIESDFTSAGYIGVDNNSDILSTP